MAIISENTLGDWAVADPMKKIAFSLAAAAGAAARLKPALPAT